MILQLVSCLLRKMSNYCSTTRLFVYLLSLIFGTLLFIVVSSSALTTHTPPSNEFNFLTRNTFSVEDTCPKDQEKLSRCLNKQAEGYVCSSLNMCLISRHTDLLFLFHPINYRKRRSCRREIHTWASCFCNSLIPIISPACLSQVLISAVLALSVVIVVLIVLQ